MDTNNPRKYRQLDDDIKQKISQTMRGRRKTYSHSQAISNGLKKYWSTIPDRPDNDNNKEKTK